MYTMKTGNQGLDLSKLKKSEGLEPLETGVFQPLHKESAKKTKKDIDKCVFNVYNEYTKKRHYEFRTKP